MGTHYGEQAIILTETGEMYVTSSILEAEGYPLVKFFDLPDILSRVSSQVNTQRQGTPNNGFA